MIKTTTLSPFQFPTMLNHGNLTLFSALSIILSLLITTSKFTGAQGPLSPPAPTSSAPLIVFAVILSAFIIALFYIFLCDADLRARALTLPTPSQFFQPRPRPLDAAALSRIPTVNYLQVKMLRPTDGENCAICQDFFQDTDVVRLIPHCSHIFHRHCIDRCFQLNCLCPICRTDLSQPVTEREPATGLGNELAPEVAIHVTDNINVEILASHRRSASLNYGPVDGEWSGIDKFQRFWSARQFSGQFGSFARSLSRRLRGEEGSKREDGEELEEQEEVPIRPGVEGGSSYRRLRSGLSTREPVDVEDGRWSAET